MVDSPKRVVLAALSVTVVMASVGCGQSSSSGGGGGQPSNGPSTGEKVGRVVVVIAKKLWKYNLIGMIYEVVDGIIKIKKIIDGKPVDFFSQPLTAGQVEQARADGEITVRIEDGAEVKVRVAADR